MEEAEGLGGLWGHGQRGPLLAPSVCGEQPWTLEPLVQIPARHF